MNGESLSGLKVAMYEVKDPPSKEEQKAAGFSYLGHAQALAVPSYLPYKELIKLISSEGEMMFGREDEDYWVIVMHHPSSDRPFCKYGRSAYYIHDVVP